jgi:xanthine dehydrogenase accessory factor
MRHVLDQLIIALEQEKPAVLATIVRSTGSAPRTSGARMLVLADGIMAGSVGGGAAEGACLKKAQEMLLNSQMYTQFDFEMTASSAANEGMICGGAISVLLQRIEADELDQLKNLRKEYRKGLHPLLLTVLPDKDVQPALLYPGAGEHFDLPDDMKGELLRKHRRTPYLLKTAEREYFVEPLVHPGTVHLVGSGHVALTVAHLAEFCGFEVVVMDDRAEFANTDRYPQAREVRVLETFDNCLEGLGPDDYVVIVTRGHLYDRDVLAQALRTEAGYVGMIGSSKKRGAVYESLRAEGFTDADLARVHSPIGISIGADTPEEIGISIVAELVQVRAEIGV